MIRMPLLTGVILIEPTNTMAPAFTNAYSPSPQGWGLWKDVRGNPPGDLTQEEVGDLETLCSCSNGFSGSDSLLSVLLNTLS
jgi:hypothetical protein